MINDPVYRPWIMLSVASHVILIAIIIIMNMFSFSRPIIINAGDGTAGSVNVDVIGLPNVLKKDIAKMEQHKEDEMVLPDKKGISKSKKTAIEKLKDALTQKENYLKKIKIIKGLKGSGGTGDSGTGSGIGENVASNPYFTGIRDIVRTYWQIPHWIKADGLNTLIEIKINADGSISALSISKASGNDDFDKLALDAVKSASPFSPPPASVRELVSNDGVILSFP